MESGNTLGCSRDGGAANRGIKQPERDGELHIINLAGEKEGISFNPPPSCCFQRSIGAHNEEIEIGGEDGEDKGRDNPSCCTHCGFNSFTARCDPSIAGLLHQIFQVPRSPPPFSPPLCRP